MTDQKPQGKALGRGLSALLGDELAAKPDTASSDQPSQTLPIEFPVRPHR